MQMLVNGTIMMKMETIYALMGLKENIQSLPKSYSHNKIRKTQNEHLNIVYQFKKKQLAHL